jgi:excisionase family DNA binding protein
MSRLFTKPEGKDYLRLSEPTVNRLIRAGRLPVVRIGRRVLFRQEDLDAFVRACLRPGVEVSADVCPQMEAVGEKV